MTGPRLHIFGLGYTAARLAGQLTAQGWQITATTRTGRGTTCMWGDPAIAADIARADYILSSVPPDEAGPDHDPVLRCYGAQLVRWPGRWIGYLSTTGVYGDTGGGWVNEASPLNDTGSSRQRQRVAADAAWRHLTAAAPIHIFRLPGIYGPHGRSALDRVRAGTANRIDLAASGIPDHVFSRAHVDDIVAVLAASMAAPAVAGPDIFNVADDLPCSGNDVVEHACDLLGLPWPPLKTLDDPSVSAMARSFYAGCRRVRNDKILRELGPTLQYPDYRSGLAACLAAERG